MGACLIIGNGRYLKIVDGEANGGGDLELYVAIPEAKAAELHGRPLTASLQEGEKIFTGPQPGALQIQAQG